MQTTQHDDLEVEVIPGTEYMRFEDGSYLASKLKTASGANQDLVLVPQPSSSLEDPLNWSRAWKLAAVANQALFCFVSLLLPLSIAPLTPILIAEFHKSVSQIALLTGLVIISLGYANLWIIPFSDVYGRRPATLICATIALVSDIWQAVSTSYESLLAARFVSGLGAAANETLMVMVVADVFFLHERGTWMGVYFYTYVTGNFLGPIISGNIAAHVSWRWFFWVCTIAQAINLVTLLLFFPETKYRRPEGEELLKNYTLTALNHGQVFDEKAKTADHMRDKNPVISQRLEDTVGMTSQTQTLPTPQEHLKPNGYPSRRQKYALITPADPIALKSLWRDILTPIQLFSFPIILWASCALGFFANSVLALNLTQSEVFGAPPYNFSPASVGFVNFAFVGGSFLGLLTAGPVSDWICVWSTRRNGGVREPEMRLPALIPFIAALAVGMSITAVGSENKWSWEVVVILGYGLVGVACATVPTLAITYAVDCYKPAAGQIMVTATIVKNTFGFGMTYYINDWAARSGYIPPIMMLAGLALGTSILGLFVFWMWGKQFRTWTMHSGVHKL